MSQFPVGSARDAANAILSNSTATFLLPPRPTPTPPQPKSGIPGVMAHTYNRRISKNASTGSATSTINSAALQDQLVRSLNLNTVLRSNRRRSNSGSSSNANANTNTAAVTTHTTAWECTQCSLINAPHTTKCSACNKVSDNGNTAALPASMTRPRTLAEIRGLADPREKPLTEEEWVGVEMEAVARGDVTGCCSICFGDLNDESVCILSCSHTFHSNCITSFERFLRTKERTCPICRRASYQKKVTDVGMHVRREDAGRVCQKVVRGWLCRLFFKNKLRSHYKGNVNVNPRRRLDFYAGALKGLGEQLEKTAEDRENSIDSLFAEFDANLAVSRTLFSGEGGAPVVPTQPAQLSAKTKKKESTLTMTEWCDVWSTTLERCGGVHECGICLSECTIANVTGSPGGGQGGQANQGQYLLSCSHLFHCKCIAAFEAFNIYEGVNLCPICRCDYMKIEVGDVVGMVMQMSYGDARWLKSTVAH